jgi:DNA-binding SARP family transcriptional activator
MKGRRVTDRVITLTNRVEIAIQLLGPPQVTLGGSLAEAPRGRKVWALLGYLLRSEGHPRREAVAGLLFPEADDPLGALRSTLFQIRRLLDSRHAVGGDPIELLLPEGALVDVDVLLRGARHDAVSLPRLGRPFLEGVNPAAGATFELWLENERRHIAGATEGVIHEAALATLAHGDTSTALDLASRLVELNPLDENAQVLYVRCLATAGHVERARRQVESCTNLFRRDLGVDPSPALREAAEARPPQIRSRGRAAVLAQLEAGEAAFAAGARHPGKRPRPRRPRERRGGRGCTPPGNRGGGGIRRRPACGYRPPRARLRGAPARPVRQSRRLAHPSGGARGSRQ